MVASVLQIGISRNPICNNLVGFPKSGHMYSTIWKVVYFPGHPEPTPAVTDTEDGR